MVMIRIENPVGECIYQNFLDVTYESANKITTKLAKDLPDHTIVSHFGNVVSQDHMYDAIEEAKTWL